MLLRYAQRASRTGQRTVGGEPPRRRRGEVEKPRVFPPRLRTCVATTRTTSARNRNGKSPVRFVNITALRFLRSKRKTRMYICARGIQRGRGENVGKRAGKGKTLTEGNGFGGRRGEGVFHRSRSIEYAFKCHTSGVTIEIGTRNGTLYILYRPCVRKIFFTSFMDDDSFSLSPSLPLSGQRCHFSREFG